MRQFVRKSFWIQSLFLVFAPLGWGATWHHPTDATQDALGINYNGSFTNPGGTGIMSEVPIYPKVALGGHGEGIVAWRETSYVWAGDLYVSEGQIGGTWDKQPTAFNFPGQNDVSYVDEFDIAMTEATPAYVIWSQKKSGFSKKAIYLATRTALGVWQKPVNVNDVFSDPAFESYAPKIAASPSGDLVVAVWVQDVNGILQVVHREYTIATGWGPIVVHSALGANSGGSYIEGNTPSVAVSDIGEAIIVWREWKLGWNSGSALFKSVRDANGVWTTPTESDRFNVPPGDYLMLQDVSMNRLGDYIILYSQIEGPPVNNYANHELYYHGLVQGVPFSSTGQYDYVSDQLDSVSPVRGRCVIDNERKSVFMFQTQTNALYNMEALNNGFTYKPNSNDTFQIADFETGRVREFAVDQNPLGTFPDKQQALAAFIVGDHYATWWENESKKSLWTREYTNGTWGPQVSVPFANKVEKSMEGVTIRVNKDGKGVMAWAQHYEVIPPKGYETSRAVYISEYY